MPYGMTGVHFINLPKVLEMDARRKYHAKAINKNAAFWENFISFGTAYDITGSWTSDLRAVILKDSTRSRY